MEGRREEKKRKRGESEGKGWEGGRENRGKGERRETEIKMG